MLATTSVQQTGNLLIDSLVWGSKWTSGLEPLTISVGIKTTGGLVPTLAESQAVQSVLAEYARVINVNFVFVGIDNSNSADITFKFYNDSDDQSYGWASSPGEALEPGFGTINILRNNYENPEVGFAKGSFDYITLTHEFGHAMGLAHPHDKGGGSTVFPGVFSPTDIGYHGLNQGIFTTMSYNDGCDGVVAGGISFWSEDRLTGEVQTGSEGFGGIVTATSNGSVYYGSQSGLMALDIMALQSLYGANTSSANGNDTYLLPAQNAVGTAFTCIWDTAGTDAIVNPLALDCVIDLRAATGLVAEGGGGYISSILAVSGGFTIAAGAVIENAAGNSGNDQLFGNSANNLLQGGAGDDELTGFAGKDTLVGGLGSDVFKFTDQIESGPTMLSADVITDFDPLYDRFDLRDMDANSDIAGNQGFAFQGFVSSFTDAAQIRAAYVSGNTVLYLNTDTDMSTESVIVLNGIHLLAADDFLL